MSELFLEDPGTLIAEEPSIKLLPFPTDQQDANFELGVSMVIYGWYTLTTAVDNKWGGPQSAEKRDWISGVIVEEFENNKEIDIIYIHELLCGIMEDEFDTVIEDQSTIEVATKIINIYKQCQIKYFDDIKNLYSKWLSKQKNGQKIVANIINDPLNPDISDDDDENNEEDNHDNDNGNDVDVEMDVDMVDVIEEHKPTGPIIDDDGFTVVTNKKGKR
ncbi:hypothetical protein C6P40_003099 [Pichia californica]|uniref:Pre-rRNA-processing protein TSR2 n=1 Tax=Pichia californica TaxID=460514 RepID=A0A9P6WJ16_9ASCO|nr:hypothetical protein C6P42_002939 [[Candida] californica]KAG0686968.1 hypothetical protein C6P40_003099 [[Candida] californica]